MVILKHTRCTNQNGAALLAVLVVALILVILMGVSSNMMQNRITLAQDSKGNWQSQAAIYAKRSELIYLLATQRHTAAGISKGEIKIFEKNNDEPRISFLPIGDEIRTDGHEYQEETGLKYAIQNAAGLIAINSSNQTWLKTWFRAKGFTRSEQSKLADSLADYADPDNIRRAAGAEVNQYLSQKKQYNNPPRNFLLQSCSELHRINYWSETLNEVPLFIQHCSLRRDEALNLNTVPISLWQVLWPNSIEKLRSNRNQNIWFLTYQDIINVESSSISQSEDYYSFLGANSFSLTITLDYTVTALHIDLGQVQNRPFKVKASLP